MTAILGPGVTATNVSFSGDDTAAASSAVDSPALGFDAGVVLGTGNVGFVVPLGGLNSDDGVSQGNFRPGDPDLDPFVPAFGTFDAAVLEFDFECPTGGVLTLKYVLASEEYNEFVNGFYNDAFGIFVNGVNVALLPDGVTPVSINTVNGGNPLGVDARTRSLHQQRLRRPLRRWRRASPRADRDGRPHRRPDRERRRSAGVNHVNRHRRRWRRVVRLERVDPQRQLRLRQRRAAGRRRSHRRLPEAPRRHRALVEGQEPSRQGQQEHDTRMRTPRTRRSPRTTATGREVEVVQAAGHALEEGLEEGLEEAEVPRWDRPLSGLIDREHPPRDRGCHDAATTTYPLDTSRSATRPAGTRTAAMVADF